MLSPQDFEQQRAAGVSEGLMRPLQGRACGEQDLRVLIVSGRYRLKTYSGPLYQGYSHLGYYDGLHYYGSYGGSHYSGHARGHHGGHGGGRH